MNKVIRFLNRPSKNVMIILIFALISWLIAMSAEIPDSVGHGGFLNLTYSWFVGIFTIVIYFLSRIFSKKFNWILTLLGIIYNLYEALLFL